VFVNKEHQLDWMHSGGAAEMNRLQPLEAKELGGHIAGTKAARSGRLAEAGRLGAEKSREIALSFQRRRAGDVTRDAQPE
jgi:hypothetical protein